MLLEVSPSSSTTSSTSTWKSWYLLGTSCMIIDPGPTTSHEFSSSREMIHWSKFLDFNSSLSVFPNGRSAALCDALRQFAKHPSVTHFLHSSRVYCLPALTTINCFPQSITGRNRKFETFLVAVRAITRYRGAYGRS